MGAQGRLPIVNTPRRRRPGVTALAVRALRRVSPKAVAALRSARARAHSHRLIKRWGLSDINQALISAIGTTVQSGPFQGLRLPTITHHGHIGPFLLGTYEMELHPWWDEILASPFDLIVDVGAQFGYYAVGLARRYPAVPVVAFDTDRWARRAIIRTAAENNVTNVIVRDYCTPEWFAGNLKPRSLIVSDCEGAELELFGSGRISPFKSVTMLIELHEDNAPGVTAAILRRFESTHSARRVESRTATSIPTCIEGLTAEDLRLAGTEIRPPQEWICLLPLSD